MVGPDCGAGEVILYRKNQQFQRQLAVARQPPPPPRPRKSVEEQQEERLEKQLHAVMRETVKLKLARFRGARQAFNGGFSDAQDASALFT